MVNIWIAGGEKENRVGRTAREVGRPGKTGFVRNKAGESFWEDNC